MAFEAWWKTRLITSGKGVAQAAFEAAEEITRRRCANLMRKEFACCSRSGKDPCYYDEHGMSLYHLILGDGDEDYGKEVAAEYEKEDNERE